MSESQSLPDKPKLASNRIVSLDQFRGYTVAGMFLVNFLGKFDACPTVLKHHHTYCSYADTIMPGFLFAVGFAFRLTFGRRAQSLGLSAAYYRVVRRFLGLAFFAIMFYGYGGPAKSWDALVDIGVWGALGEPLKRQWFQTLMHIAVTALWLTPVIRASAAVRVLYMVVSAGLHVFLSYKFNFLWCNHPQNVIDGGPLAVLTWTIPAMVGTLACDAVVNAPGRPKLMKMSAWAVLLMVLGYGFSCGEKLYDLSPEELVAHKKARVAYAAKIKVAADEIAALNKPLEAPRKKIGELTAELAKLQRAGLIDRFKKLRAASEYESWSDWDLTDLADEQLKKDGYENPRVAEIEPEIETIKKENHFERVEKLTKQLEEKKRIDFYDLKIARDPVWPSKERIENTKAKFREQGITALLADVPLFHPQTDDPRIATAPFLDHRIWNYWMMTQRGGSLSYLTFSAGFNLLVFVLFYILGDNLGVTVGVFRTFGMNALAGYIAHEWVGGTIKPFMPEDVPAWYMWAGFSLFFYLTYVLLKHLENQKIFLRL